MTKRKGTGPGSRSHDFILRANERRAVRQESSRRERATSLNTPASRPDVEGIAGRDEQLRLDVLALRAYIGRLEAVVEAVKLDSIAAGRSTIMKALAAVGDES